MVVTSALTHHPMNYRHFFFHVLDQESGSTSAPSGTSSTPDELEHTSDGYDSDKDPEFDVNEEPASTDSDSDSDASPAPTNSAIQTPPASTSTPLNTNHTTPPENSGNLVGLTDNTERRSRKRKRNPGKWRKRETSKAYNNGKRYKRKGEISTRKVGGRCACKRKRCLEMSDDERDAVHTAFWTLSTQNERANYIISHCSKIPKKRQTLQPILNRGDNMKYFLPRTDRTTLEVCKKFFQSTLCISDKMISYNLSRSVDGVKPPTVQPPTVRPPPANKIQEDAVQSVIDHIKLFPTIESHYCRSTTQRLYLDPNLNKSKMFRAYKESPLHHPSIKQHFYSKVFDENFNLGFHNPSKDVCDACDKYNKRKLAGEMSAEVEEEKKDHDKRKKQARDEKEKDKGDASVMTVTCDLQQVMTAPKLFAGSSYYRRKLNVYNFTIYELPTGEGLCYTWTEAECHRGANDVASCLVKYLTRVDVEGKYSKVIIYSDTCGGQNRNRIVCTAIASFLSSAVSVKVVEQKYFESGHSHMECDSMHSAIEGTFRKREISLPSDYISCMKQARCGKPYQVVELDHTDITDFGALNEVFKKDAFKSIIKIKTHFIHYNKGRDIEISMNDCIEEPVKDVVWRKRGAPKSLSGVKPAYNTACGIDKEKKADLLAMTELAECKSIYSLYYKSLSLKE